MQVTLQDIQTGFTEMVANTFPYALSSVQSYKTSNKDVRKKTTSISLPILPVAGDEPVAGGGESQTYKILKDLKQFTYESVAVVQGTWRMFGYEILPKQDKDADGTGEITSAEITAMKGLRAKEAEDKFFALFTGLVAGDFNKDAAVFDADKVFQVSIAKDLALDVKGKAIVDAIGDIEEYQEVYKDANIDGIDMNNRVSIISTKGGKALKDYRYSLERTGALFAALIKPNWEVDGNLIWKTPRLGRQTWNGEKAVMASFHKDAIFVEDPMASMIEFDETMVGNKLVGIRYRDTMQIIKKGAIAVVTEITA